MSETRRLVVATSLSGSAVSFSLTRSEGKECDKVKVQSVPKANNQKINQISDTSQFKTAHETNCCRKPLYLIIFVTACSKVNKDEKSINVSIIIIN